MAPEPGATGRFINQLGSGSRPALGRRGFEAGATGKGGVLAEGAKLANDGGAGEMRIDQIEALGPEALADVVDGGAGT